MKRACTRLRPVSPKFLTTAMGIEPNYHHHEKRRHASRTERGSTAALLLVPPVQWHARKLTNARNDFKVRFPRNQPYSRPSARSNFMRCTTSFLHVRRGIRTWRALRGTKYFRRCDKGCCKVGLDHQGILPEKTGQTNSLKQVGAVELHPRSL